MTKILTVTKHAPESKLIDEAVSYLEAGQVVAYPTETIYGLGVDVTNEKAIKRLFDLKRRDYGLPISILVSDLAMLNHIADTVPESAKKLMKMFWPGPLTILFPAGANISTSLTTNTGKIGIRISSHPVAMAIIKILGKPISTTSANLSGFPPSLQVKHIQKYFGEKIPCIVDSGECVSGRGSTVVDVSDETMAIIREGSISSEKVIECFQSP